MNHRCREVTLDIFNILWSSSLIPDDWKVDCIVPILKPGKKPHIPDSYRPIALTSCLGKIFEQLIKNRLEFYIENNCLLPSNQFGFRRGKSSRESIEHLQLDIFNSMKNNNILIAVFFDIVGAFNNVNHHILALELRSLGIPEKIVQWVFNFLHGRKVFVKINNNSTILGPRYSFKGVCQGGILSPLVFILYIHKLNIILGSKVSNLQYADDLVIYMSGSNVGDLVSSINESLGKLHSYFSYLNLDINADKSKVVIFNKIRPFHVKIVYNKSILNIDSCAKFLGIIFNNNLSWTKYVNSIADRASRAFNVLKALAGTSWGADPKILLMLYKSLVRSHFEYGFLCFASNRKLVNKLDIIQNKNLRLITGAMRTTPIVSMQAECLIPPLILRFKYLKFRFLFYMISFSNHPLFRKILSYYDNILAISESTPYILHEFSDIIQYDQQYSIHKCMNNLPCHNGSYDSKFSNMYINIKENLSNKEEVFELIAQYFQFRHIYTDGSKKKDKASCAFYVPHLKLGRGFPLPTPASIYTAECYAIVAALQFITDNPTVSSKWLLITDSMSVLKALQSRTLDAKTTFIIYEIKKLWWILHEKNIEIQFLWTPSHIGVTGNENADFLARSTVDADIDSIDQVAIPYTDFYSILKKKLKEEWKSYWINILEEGKGLWYASINPEIPTIPWFSRTKNIIGRQFYSTISRLRFGHYRLNAHLARKKIITSSSCNYCNSDYDQTADHIILDCPAFTIERLLLIEDLINIYGESESVPRALQDILRNVNTYKPLYKFILRSVKEI